MYKLRIAFDVLIIFTCMKISVGIKLIADWPSILTRELTLVWLVRLAVKNATKIFAIDVFQHFTWIMDTVWRLVQQLKLSTSSI